MAEPRSRSEELGAIGARVRESLIKAMAQVHGDRPSDAQPLAHAEEVEQWRLPTSPAAVEAFKRGGTLEEATDANRMWAAGMKQQQEQMRASGASEDDIHSAGFSDEAIFKTCRQHAYERGKANGKNDPALEAKWHREMAKRVAAQREQPTYQTMGGGGGGDA
jgi:hypothetical protein